MLRKSRIAVFVDGCYWHGCPEHHTQPVTNFEYWADKIARNIQRGAETTACLRKAGRTVLRCWEHEDPKSVADRVQESVRASDARKERTDATTSKSPRLAVQGGDPSSQRRVAKP
ncbi:MAG: very short patch repair endonuclease [Acidimicrobiaceae bacterium]|nr:very short patch repair endonuclease [Acidimicrobiaceae bacterium]